MPSPPTLPRLLRSLSLLCIAAPAWGGVQESAAVIPGLHGRHPLDEVAVGRLLLDELQCGACHTGIAPDAVRSAAPDLADVGGRVSPEYLRRFIADPSGVRPGTKMPALLRARPPLERAEVAEAITHFLVAGSSRGWSPGEVLEDENGAGEELFHTVGCVACHAPGRPPADRTDIPPVGRGVVDLGHVPAKYGVDSLADFLFDPTHARPSGRMPDMGLARAEAEALAGYLIGSGPRTSSSFDVRPDLVARGRKAFEELDCAACHALDGLRAAPAAPAVGDLDPRRGCLAPDDANTPRFGLDTTQIAAIASALRAPVAELTDADRIAHTLTAFNCIACHERDDYGGVRTAVDPYFTTDEPELGDEARIPPQLTLAGAKLEGEWLRKVLFDGASVRRYMFTRMPRFGESNLAHLAPLFEREDGGRIEPFEMPVYEGEAARVARDAGRELMGIRGLACVTCHDFNGRPAPTHGGMDLIDSPQRLKPSWFARFLVDPVAYRPGIVMPESWSGGVASHTGILDGDTEAQIRAIWFFLSEGRMARDPEGIRATPSRLTVTDTTRTYRGRSRVAGFRGIAVGFPGGVSYAFDANHGALAALWRGDFVSVRWDGQGAGDFSPSARPIELARDVAFCRLADPAGAWPLRPVREKEGVNPDPQYPRNHGYRFRGYSFNDESNPMFRYESGSVSIEDGSIVVGTGERPVLRRMLRLTVTEPERLYFRALTGDFEAVSEREYRLARVGLTIPDIPAVVREPEGGPRELLLALDLAPGTFTFSLDYAFLD